MAGGVRIIKHETVPQCGSFEVRFADGRESKFFYWDDLPSRRLRADILTSEQAREQPRRLLGIERDKGELSRVLDQFG